MKIKIDTKRCKVFYDAEGKRLSNGHWAIRLQWSGPKTEIVNKDIAALVSAGRSFTLTADCNPDFTSKTPDFDAIMDKAWENTRGQYSKAHKTKWGWRGRDEWMVEYENEKGQKAYFDEKYSNMIEESGWKFWVRDGESAAYLAEEQGQDYVLAIFMPCKGPEGRK